MEFERKELQVIRERALEWSRLAYPVGDVWVRACADLAQAANNLDVAKTPSIK